MSGRAIGKEQALTGRIIFLREFIAGPGASAPPVLSGTSTPRSENGKAREQRKDAFVPENVYDAMKENKRFDSMRVRSSHCSGVQN